MHTAEVNMGRVASLLALLFLLCAGAGRGDFWARSYATEDWITAWEIWPSGDCGHIVVGQALDLSDPMDPEYDHCVMKLNAQGDVTWARTYGGTEWEDVPSIAQTKDGGFVMAGSTQSFGAPGWNLWVLKLDSQGSLQWQKRYTEGFAGRTAVKATADGGVVMGQTGGILKLDAAGQEEWGRWPAVALGEGFCTMESTADGGLVVLGQIVLDDGDPDSDLFVAKLDASGYPEWDRAYGGPVEDYCNDGEVIPTLDGGYVLTGRTRNPDATDPAMVVLKLGSLGEIEWQRAFERPEDIGQALRGLAETSSGAILVGIEHFVARPPWTETRVLKLDSAGNLVWLKNYGGNDHEQAYDLLPTQGEGFLVAGRTSVHNDRHDAWILRLDGEGLVGGDACGFITELPVTERSPGFASIELNPTVQEVSEVGIPTDAEVRDLAITMTERCSAPACLPVRCGEVRADPQPACEGTTLSLELSAACGDGTVSVEWDLDGDTVTDQSGNPIQADLPAGSREVVATVTDSCADPGPQGCEARRTVEVLSAAPPGEVSGVSAGARPVLVESGGAALIVEANPEAAGYNVYADRIGSWYQPSAATGSVCGVTSWTDNGDGTITLDYEVPAGSWVVVTGSTPCAEGPAGADSAGTERTLRGAWEFCGPIP